eukprot:5350937-Pleurochrysis_carterae.AAC.1
MFLSCPSLDISPSLCQNLLFVSVSPEIAPLSIASAIVITTIVLALALKHALSLASIASGNLLLSNRRPFVLRYCYALALIASIRGCWSASGCCALRSWHVGDSEAHDGQRLRQSEPS